MHHQMTWRHQTPWTMDLGQSTDKYVLISCSHYLPTFSTQSSSFPSHHLNLAHKQCRAWVLLQIHTARHSTLQREYLLKHLQNIYSVQYLLCRISTLYNIYSTEYLLYSQQKRPVVVPSRVVIVNPTYMSPAPGPDSCWGRRPAARSLLVAELLLLKTSRIIYLRCHFVTTKGVNDPSQSFIVPGESPFQGLFRIEIRGCFLII